MSFPLPGGLSVDMKPAVERISHLNTAVEKHSPKSAGHHGHPNASVLSRVTRLQHRYAVGLSDQSASPSELSNVLRPAP